MDKLIKLDASSIKELVIRTVKNLSWLFIFVFFIILILDILRIKNSVQIVLNVNAVPVLISKEKGVRIDFVKYDKVIERIRQGSNYKPQIEITSNPFSLN